MSATFTPEPFAFARFTVSASAFSIGLETSFGA